MGQSSAAGLARGVLASEWHGMPERSVVACAWCGQDSAAGGVIEGVMGETRRDNRAKLKKMMREKQKIICYLIFILINHFCFLNHIIN